MPDLRRLALVVEYEGTEYQGFQWQPQGPTIQSELESALYKLTGRNIRVSGASRTDAGVHARGQVVSFPTDSALTTQTFVAALNFYLPKDITVKCAIDVPSTFDPRRDAFSRRYTYSILNDLTSSPLRRKFIYWLPGALDLEAMGRACRSLMGVHDFASFCASLDHPGASTIRHLLEAGVTRNGDLTMVKVEANAFLPHQVRRTVGELVEVAQGRKTVEEFIDLVERPRPGTAGPALPARGLCLEKVTYLNVKFPAPRDAEKPLAVTAVP